ncbi:MAG TPA: ferrochelatase [Xanthomonadaceae bacterium]|nr:ferrochelatase [Xanthomonadaceae bacterium]
MSAPDDTSASDALLLVNLGTPETPTPRAVRRFLAEFLHDHRVIDMSRWLWCPLLHGVILPLRAPKLARKYASIWMAEGSPLAVHTARLAAAVQGQLPGLPVRHAMRYGAPSVGAALSTLQADGARRVVVLPLYPQYSTSTTASVADAIAPFAGNIELRLIEDYHLDAGWVAAIAASIRAQREPSSGAHLLLSFHGLPQRFADRGDPYPRQCEASARAIAAALGLAGSQWTLAYQSRFGRDRWLQPATIEVLDNLMARGVQQVDIVCPGFATDCLETLEEVQVMLSERFAAHGGVLRYIPCLNDAPAHAAALADIARRAVAERVVAG